MNILSLSPTLRLLAIKWLWRSISSGHFDIGKVIDPLTKDTVPRESLHLPEDAIQRWSEIDSEFISRPLTDRQHYTLVEAAWLRLLLTVESKGIPLNELNGMRRPLLHDRKTVQGFIASPLFKKAILMFLPKKAKERAAKAFTSPSSLTDKVIGLIPAVSFFDALVFAHAHYGVTLGLFRDSDGNWTLVSHDIPIEGMLDSTDMTRCFRKHGEFISIDGLLEGLQETVVIPAKPQLTALSENERTLLSYLRGGMALKRLSIRFDKDGEMGLLELTRTQILESTKQIENIIRGGEYYDIAIESGNGKVFKFESTQKIKLK